MSQNFDRARTAVALEALRLLRPYTLSGSDKLRVGRDNDGGYIMVDRFDGVTAAYSLGINDDVSWDLEIAARGIPVFQYDHTIAHLPVEHPLFHWKATRIDGTADAVTDTEDLASIVAQNKHGEDHNLILKCDIEGSEWPLLQQTPSAVLAQFRQIVLELHHMAYLSDSQHADNVLWALRKLTESHRVVHVHGNNHSPFIAAGGITVPYTLELTLLRRDEGLFLASKESFPTTLDMPCNPNLADLYLGRFTFD